MIELKLNEENKNLLKRLVFEHDSILLNIFSFSKLSGIDYNHLYFYHTPNKMAEPLIIDKNPDIKLFVVGYRKEVYNLTYNTIFSHKRQETIGIDSNLNFIYPKIEPEYEGEAHHRMPSMFDIFDKKQENLFDKKLKDKISIMTRTTCPLDCGNVIIENPNYIDIIRFYKTLYRNGLNDFIKINRNDFLISNLNKISDESKLGGKVL